MTAHTIRQQRADAAHRAQLNKQDEQRRSARNAEIRDRFERRLLIDRGGWLWAAMAIGAAIGLLVERFAS